ncbi:uncharacterized protein FOMMEDRAFT_160093 [Fomitiporia mediterranea MF3/22]|uniref:uncharacterized protein n=1 Tax=Fomitiporia mediterranea (strain MF3/22) TaxID=694068 RepID=UPI0004407CB6|nr:uncharacterized protein FOMMEDRAFT_160093 [Fomitiporia mediterranea MF3/22]EJC99666.1 hypothetical protein FOMMEDRAFT_160093 [Fomitiporia mediterranea MF3/22]
MKWSAPSIADKGDVTGNTIPAEVRRTPSTAVHYHCTNAFDFPPMIDSHPITNLLL